MAEAGWTVYLSGEIHTAWRDRIRAGAKAAGLDVAFVSPVTDHAASDDCGVVILGDEERPFWKDHKGARVNAIRNRTLIRRADIVVVRFGDKYRQWNAAFDAGYAAALDKPIITLHEPALTHALKEVDGAALAVAESPEQVVELLALRNDRHLALRRVSARSMTVEAAPGTVGGARDLLGPHLPGLRAPVAGGDAH